MLASRLGIEIAVVEDVGRGLTGGRLASAVSPMYAITKRFASPFEKAVL
jgi:hypothetical protein